MSNGLRDFVERVRERVRASSGDGPPFIIEANSEEEAARLVKEHEAEWGPDHDVLVIVLGEETTELA